MSVFKVSFDFDGTLSKDVVQEYAYDLIGRGVDVWICTYRLPNFNNGDLRLVAMDLGIPITNIIFTSHNPKEDYLNGKEFLWHLDDCKITTDFINDNSDVVGVHFNSNFDWMGRCEYIMLNKLN